MRSTNILSKVFAVAAVVLVMALTCVVAFADVTPAADWTDEGEYTVNFGGGNRVPYIASISKGSSYEITPTRVYYGNCDVAISYDDGATWVDVHNFAEDVTGDAAAFTYVATDDGYIRFTLNSINSSCNFTASVNVAPPAPLAGVLDMTTGFATEMFSIGTSLVSWITSHPIAVIAVGLFILVALVGGIRRLIVGV